MTAPKIGDVVTWRELRSCRIETGRLDARSIGHTGRVVEVLPDDCYKVERVETMVVHKEKIVKVESV